MKQFIEKLKYAKLLGDPNQVELIIEKEIIDIIRYIDKYNYISEFIAYDKYTSTIYVADIYVENLELYKIYKHNWSKIISTYYKHMFNRTINCI